MSSKWYNSSSLYQWTMLTLMVQHYFPFQQEEASHNHWKICGIFTSSFSKWK